MVTLAYRHFSIINFCHYVHALISVGVKLSINFYIHVIVMKMMALGGVVVGRSNNAMCNFHVFCLIG